jgi:hypothetical protein
MTTIFDSPAGLASMLSAIILLGSVPPTNHPDSTVIGMLLFAIKAIYGNMEEGRDAYHVITECYMTRSPYTITKADSLEIVLNHSSDCWV